MQPFMDGSSVIEKSLNEMCFIIVLSVSYSTFFLLFFILFIATLQFTCDHSYLHTVVWARHQEILISKDEALSEEAHQEHTNKKRARHPTQPEFRMTNKPKGFRSPNEKTSYEYLFGFSYNHWTD